MFSTLSGGVQFTPLLPAAAPPTTTSPSPTKGPTVVDQAVPSSLDDDDPALALFCRTPIPTVVLDPSRVIRQVSHSYLDVSGACGRDQILGLTIDELLDKTLTLPSLSTARKAIRASEETKRPYTLNQVQADGTTWAIRTVPLYHHGRLQYVQMELTDITEERRKQLELEEKLYANETFRILVETVKDYAIFMLDPKGYIATWNAGAHKFKGYTKDEIIGKHFSNFYGKEDRESGKPARELADALRDGRVEDEGWRYRKDGTRFWANVIITPIYRDDVLLGFAKVTRDLSERRKAEADLIAAYEESSKLKSEFLANMSHEIRTPMHGMLSALTLLRDTHLDTEQVELARVMEDSGEVLVQVINDILDYSKLAQGCFSISHDIINVADIIQSVFRSHIKSSKPELKLEIQLDPELPVAAEGDSLRYRQVVQNLMSNATKFTEDGYVRVNATLQEKDDEAYTILTEVIDSGVGIPSDVSGALFRPFTQFDNSATKRFKGTGLGLSICKSLASLMDGDIGFYPNPEGHGSVFYFTAKLKRIQQMTMIDHLQQKLDNATISPVDSPMDEIRLIASSKTVLLAEDNPINQKVMLKILNGLGFGNINVAGDGKEAVSIAGKTSHDLILMDINMPVLDGVGATKEIRRAGIATPIIAMTANALKGQAETYIAKGMTAYVSKPVDRKLLVNVILNCFKDSIPE
ncbi:sensor histidine kinase-like protein/response regulator Fos-1 [Dendryphion nanum]|uniref:Sensor histidine kinase-like protein/response regulator Fos-1 n=1 Tax=Dendryphion nanum TaxID=256645 RepID=A0A9P9DP12_9PLEO|nr:sensor histidine kinase-like protein/response regulator Fos-1 [Dendryphion nanum]